VPGRSGRDATRAGALPLATEAAAEAKVFLAVGIVLLVGPERSPDSERERER
jgi:hypothetical protein